MYRHVDELQRKACDTMYSMRSSVTHKPAQVALYSFMVHCGGCKRHSVVIPLYVLHLQLLDDHSELTA
jgi:hypothetical protein